MARTRTTSFVVFGLFLLAAAPWGCEPAPKTGTSASACKPLAEAPCYTGPPIANGVGACSPGTAVCSADGAGFGECVGSVLPSFQSCATGVDTDCDGRAACSGAHEWSQGFLGQGDKIPRDVFVDKAGNITIAGEFDITADLGGGELKADTSLMLRDIFVARYDAAGKHLWSKKIGDAADQRLYGVAMDPSGDLLLTGYSETPLDFEGEALDQSFVLKLGPDGAPLWSIKHGGDVAVDEEGNILLASSLDETFTYETTTLTSAGGRDALIAKFDPDGKFLWAISAGGAGNEYLHLVETDGEGNITVAGQYTGVADLGGGPLPPGTNDSNQFAFLAQFDKNGAFRWSRSFVGNYVRLRHINADKEGNIFMGGDIQGPVDFGGGLGLDVVDAPFLAKIDPSGVTLSVTAYQAVDTDGTLLYSALADVAFDAENNALVLGAFAGGIDLGGGVTLKSSAYAVFIAKYDAAGKIIWGMTPGGGGASYSTGGISADPLGGVVVTGTYGNATDFGGGILYGLPEQEQIFLARLAP